MRVEVTVLLLIECMNLMLSNGAMKRSGDAGLMQYEPLSTGGFQKIRGFFL